MTPFGRAAGIPHVMTLGRAAGMPQVTTLGRAAGTHQVAPLRRTAGTPQVAPLGSVAGMPQERDGLATGLAAQERDGLGNALESFKPPSNRGRISRLDPFLVSAFPQTPPRCSTFLLPSEFFSNPLITESTARLITHSVSAYSLTVHWAERGGQVAPGLLPSATRPAGDPVDSDVSVAPPSWKLTVWSLAHLAMGLETLTVFTSLACSQRTPPTPLC